MYFKTTPHTAAKSNGSGTTKVPIASNPNRARASGVKPAPLTQKGGCASCGKRR